MKIKDFEKRITEVIGDMFSEYSVGTGMVPKPSGEYYGIIIKKENGYSMAFDLEKLYDMFDREIKPEDVSDLVKEIRDGMNRNFQVQEKFMDYEEAKDSLFVMAEPLNYAYAEKVPFISYGGDVMYTFRLVEEFQDGQVLSVVVTREIVEGWGVDKKRLMEDAFTSSRKIAPEVIDQIELSPIGMWVITNKYFTCGASACLYPGVLDSIAEEAGSDLYIIPSSIHEVLVIPKWKFVTRDYIKDAISDVNKTLDKDDVLSGCVFMYKAGKKVICEAE